MENSMGPQIASGVSRVEAHGALDADVPPVQSAVAAAGAKPPRLTATFGALASVARLPSELVSARGHGLLLSQHRRLFLAERLEITALFFGVATVAWIPIDVFLFQADWAVVVPLAIARLIASALFLVMAFAARHADTPNDMIARLGLTVVIGTAFYFAAHIILSYADEGHLRGAGHAQYVLMPIALVAWIAIFPLTLKEGAGISLLPLAAILAETIHGDGGAAVPQASAAVLLMCAVLLAAVACSVGQLNLLAKLHRESTIDSLSGALSRRAGVELLDLMFRQCRRDEVPFSLAFIDLDQFKIINDAYGHETGDHLLRQVAARLKTSERSGGALIRWGGEEFIVSLPGIDADTAATMVATAARSLGLRPDGQVQTVSIGLSERLRDQAPNWRALVELADSRMYQSKRSGRDRLVGPDGRPHRLVGQP
jgi:diguanylate cyclase (GGDEF)-like protein